MSLLDRVVGVTAEARTFILGSGAAVSVVTSPDVTPPGAAIAVGILFITVGLAGMFAFDLEDADDTDEPSAEPDLNADVEETSNEVAVLSFVGRIAGTAGITDVTEELAVFLGGERTGVSEATLRHLRLRAPQYRADPRLGNAPDYGNRRVSQNR